jgi:hypothetical protein
MRKYQAKIQMPREEWAYLFPDGNDFDWARYLAGFLPVVPLTVKPPKPVALPAPVAVDDADLDALFNAPVLT